MRLLIDTTKKKFYRQLLELLRAMPPLDGLRNREIGLLSMLMYYNYLYRSIEETIRWRVINDTATRREIQETLEMNEDIFNNNMSILRKAGILEEGDRIVKFLQLLPNDDKFSISFNFNIKDNG